LRKIQIDKTTVIYRILGALQVCQIVLPWHDCSWLNRRWVCYNLSKEVAPVTRGDVILVISAVIVAILAWAGFTYLPAKHQELVAIVTVDGKEVSRLAVSTQTLKLVAIPVPRGEATLEYGHGKVRVLPMDHTVCPNEICWRTGWISSSGQSIVCVPNRMVITLQGLKSEIDLILR
jgi:hypothetical protein